MSKINQESNQNVNIKVTEPDFNTLLLFVSAVELSLNTKG